MFMASVANLYRVESIVSELELKLVANLTQTFWSRVIKALKIKTPTTGLNVVPFHQNFFNIYSESSFDEIKIIETVNCNL